jgi:hypothetical protein
MLLIVARLNRRARRMHRDDPTLGLEALHGLDFLVGQRFRDHLIEPELPCHGVGGGPAVARYHDDANPIGAQCADRFDRIRLDGIGNADEPRELAVDGDEEHRLTVAPERVHAGHEWTDIDAEVAHQRFVPERNRLTFDASQDAFARPRLEGGRLD